MPEMRFMEDKPKDCRYCYFWSEKKNVITGYAWKRRHAVNVTAALTGRSRNA